ncbi:hypothetical protein BH23BAC3_BH23BAC3_19540 [soil metagenome]
MKPHFISVAVAIFMITACGPTEQEQAQQDQRQMELQQLETSDLHFNFRMEMDTVLTRYFALKDALVESDPEQSAEKAEELSEFSSGVMDEVLDSENRGLWVGIARIINTETDNLIAEDDVDEQRIYFERISNAMIQMVESFNPVGYTIYHQSCPMVRDGSADWLSRQEGIRNPYYGDRMMNCGEVVRQL